MSDEVLYPGFSGQNPGILGEMLVYLEIICHPGLTMRCPHKTGVDTVALKYCIATLKPFKVLSGASQQHQLRTNLLGNTFDMYPEEVEELSSFKVDPKDYWAERKLLGWN